MTTQRPDNAEPSPPAVTDETDASAAARISDALAMVRDGARLHAERMAEQLRLMEAEGGREGGQEGGADGEWAGHQDDVEAVSKALSTLFEIEKSLIETRATVELLLQAAARRNRALIQSRLARELDAQSATDGA